MKQVNISENILNRIIFRAVQPTDIPRCHQIEAASYPEDEAASKSTLQYRQHHAAPFFRCAFLVGDSGNPGSGSPGGTTSTSSSISYQGRSMNPAATLRGTIIGFVCATRCKSFKAEAMKTHDGTGKILAIHSVVVQEQYRKCGVASAMLQDYVSAMERLNNKGNLKVKMEKIVLMAKKDLLAFYVRNGFKAMGVSPVVHGKEQWFELETIFSSSEESDAKTHECYIVDSFADVEKQGSGNPAGVVLLDGPPGEEQSNSNKSDDSSLDEMDDGESDDKPVQDRGVSWMKIVAKEFNQSETAFIWPLPHKTAPSNGCLCPPQNNAQSPAYAIRYYTRTGVEVDLCGHATLAAASVLLLPKKIDDPKQNHKINFFAKNDDLQSELLVPPANSQPTTPVASSNKACRIAMNFPWKNVTPVSPGKGGQEEVVNMITKAFFGAAAKDQAARFCQFGKDQTRSNFMRHVLQIGTTDGKEDLLIELSQEGFDLLCGLNVEYAALSVWQGYTRGVIICCASEPPTESTKQTTPFIDFRSRFFGPNVGIDEDPVTGSAHCSLGPYFGNKLGKTTVVGRQESERGGLVECILKPEEGRVCIVGTAVVTVSGQLSINMF
ncbi:hypothetical protein ACHAXR_011696 [Thalassiosira sp. AJA248-18]